MQLSVYIFGYPYMSYIQSRKIRGDGNDITVHDPRKSCVGEFAFRQPVYLFPGQCLFMLGHPFHVLRRIRQLPVLLGMGGHIRERQFGGLRTVLCSNVFQKSLADTVLNPVGGIVQPRSVSVDHTVPITYLLQIIGKRRPHRLSQRIFDESKAIYRLGQDD